MTDLDRYTIIQQQMLDVVRALIRLDEIDHLLVTCEHYREIGPLRLGRSLSDTENLSITAMIEIGKVIRSSRARILELIGDLDQFKDDDIGM